MRFVNYWGALTNGGDHDGRPGPDRNRDVRLLVLLAKASLCFGFRLRFFSAGVGLKDTETLLVFLWWR